MFGGRQSFGVGDYFHRANDQTMVIVLLEEAEALENLDDILKVEGLKMIYIGPSDLSNSLGCTPTFDQEEKPVVEAIDYVLRKSLEQGIIPGIHNGFPPYALKMVEKGFRFVTISNDARLLGMGAKNFVDKMREGMDQGNQKEALMKDQASGY